MIVGIRMVEEDGGIDDFFLHFLIHLTKMRAFRIFLHFMWSTKDLSMFGGFSFVASELSETLLGMGSLLMAVFFNLSCLPTTMAPVICKEVGKNDALD